MLSQRARLYKLQDDICNRLSILKQMLEASRTQQIQIDPEQMEPFMEKVIPGLMKLGSVHIAQAVSERIVQTPLKAKLYLDRVRDRFWLDWSSIMEALSLIRLRQPVRLRGEGHILMRDGDQEGRILELLEQSGFTATEGGYFLSDEDAEYDFLYHIMPELERLADVICQHQQLKRGFTWERPLQRLR